MTDNTTLPPPPKPNQTLVSVPSVGAPSPSDVDMSGVDHMFKAISSLQVEEPEASAEQRTEAKQFTRLSDTETLLAEHAQNDPTLVHSAAAVFDEVRYYDAARLRMYAQNIYQQLNIIIGSNPDIPMAVKSNLPDFNYLAFPLQLNPNLAPTRLTVYVNHKEPKIQVSIEIEFTGGRKQMFTSTFTYKV